MKTASLVVALAQLVGAACCAVAAVQAAPLPLGVICAIGILVNGLAGVNGALESLFGRGGLVCEVFPTEGGK